MDEPSAPGTGARAIMLTALPGNGLARLAEIDRSEQVRQGYRMVGGERAQRLPERLRLLDQQRAAQARQHPRQHPQVVNRRPQPDIGRSGLEPGQPTKT